MASEKERLSLDACGILFRSGCSPREKIDVLTEWMVRTLNEMSYIEKQLFIAAIQKELEHEK